MVGTFGFATALIATLFGLIGAAFIAALDQSGGSTPGALRAFGVPDTAYNGDSEMFAAIHSMRVRITPAPAFRGEKVLAANPF